MYIVYAGMHADGDEGQVLLGVFLKLSRRGGGQQASSGTILHTALIYSEY